MADPTARAIVDSVLALRQSHPHAPALDVLDLAMKPHRGTSPEFDAGRSDLTDPGAPFGDVLRQAFDPAYDVAALEAAGLDPDEIWQTAVLRPFYRRYDFGSATP